MEAISDYNFATGQFKVLPILGVAGKTEAEYKKAMLNFRYIFYSFAYSQTQQLLGHPQKIMVVNVSFWVLTNMVQGIKTL